MPNKNILLGVTGGIAAVKAPQIVSQLKKAGCDVRVVLTPAAARFVTPLSFESLTLNPVGLDMFTREYPREIQHISWAQWAHAALVAPATANTIAKMANGIADNLLTSILLAMTCPVAVSPSMNTNMLSHGATQDNLASLRKRGVYIIEPASGPLACGDDGKGRLPEPNELVRSFLDVLPSGKPFAGRRILITAGPTEEPIDPVRCLTNHSSGRMGYALAQQARFLGADVTLVSGPVSLEAPSDVRVIRVTTAQQMFDAVMEEKCSSDVVIGCAAVSDYRPVITYDKKLKKSEALTIELVKTPDILSELGKDKSYYLAGFAAETDDVLSYAEGKLTAKNLDMIVANDVSDSSIGFGSPDNQVTILRKDKAPVVLTKAPKTEIAREILQTIAQDMGL